MTENAVAMPTSAVHEPVPFSEEQVERIIAARIAGRSLRDIASDLSTNHRRIGRLLARPQHAARVREGQRAKAHKAGDRERQRRLRERRTAAATPEGKAAAAALPRDPADRSRGKVGSDDHFPWINSDGWIHFSRVWVGSLAPRPANASDYATYFPHEPIPAGLGEPTGYGPNIEEYPDMERPPLGWEPPRVKLRPPIGSEDRDVFKMTRNTRDPLEVERLLAEGWQRVA